MPVNSKSSQGNNSMYVQPSDKPGTSPPTLPPGASRINTKITKQETVDSVKISAGDDFYSIYTDQTLESALVSRGLSQLRPEVIGSFEFVPPLSSDSANVSQADGQVVYNSSGAGELIDMQNQLKQLRYGETLYYLRVKCGLLAGSTKFYQTNDMGGNPTFCTTDADVPEGYSCVLFNTESDGPTLADYYPSATSDDTALGMLLSETTLTATPSLIQPFYDEMNAASSVLSFLSAALSVYDLKTALDIKVNNYIEKNSADSTTTAGSIADRLDLYDDDFVSNKAPGNISLESYLKDFLGVPESYWDNASPTAIVMQLIADAVGRTAYPQETFSSCSPSESNVFGAGEILGINKNEYSGGYELIKQLGKVDLSELQGSAADQTYFLDGELQVDFSGDTGTPMIDSDSTGTSMFTRGDFMELWDRVVDDKDTRLFYVVARDFINHCQKKSDGALATGGNTVEERLASLIGWNPFEQIKNLAEIQADDSGESLGINAARPQHGETDVANFNKGGGDTPSGGEKIKPGVEYFLSEFLAGNSIAGSLEKMADFSGALNTLTSELLSFLDNSFTPNKGSGRGVPENSLAYGTGGSINPFSTPASSGGERQMTAMPMDSFGDGEPTVPTLQPAGISSDSGGTSNSAALVQRVFEELAKQLYTTYYTDLEADMGTICNCMGESGQMLWFAAAANDPEVAWQGLKYFLCRDRVMKGDYNFRLNNSSMPAGSQLAALGQDLINYTINYLQLNIDNTSHLTKHGYGFDEDGFAYEDADQSYTSSTQSSNNSVSISISYPGGDLSTDYDGAWFSNSTFGTISEWELTNVLPDESGTETLTGALSDSIGRALEYWEVATADGFGVESELSNSGNVWEGLITDDLGIGREGRLIMCYLFGLMVFQQTQKLAVWVPSENADSSSGIWSKPRWSLSKRAIASLYDAYQLDGLADPDDWDLDNSAYASKDNSQWAYQTGSGHKDGIEEAINLFWTYYRPQLEFDVLAWNSLYFLTEISDRVRETIDEILSTFSGSWGDMSITESLSSINSSGNLSELVSASLTKDQVTLGQYIYKTTKTENYKMPYLPGTSAIESNQAMCLGTLSKINYLVESPMSGKKRIFAIGLPSGMIEFLRNSAAEEMSNPRYNESNVIKISLWRRDLLKEEVCETPQEFLFDVSRFILDGSTAGAIAGSDSGAANQFFPGQTVEDLLSNVCCAKFNRSGYVESWEGQAYDDDVISSFDGEFEAMDNLIDVMGNASISDSTSNALVQVFNNHVLDHYLKIYLQLTSGVDVKEQSFCFIEDETIITGPDPDKTELKRRMTSLLASMYNANDLAAGITFQRIRGELDRSVILSPKKYRNRVIYPKIFDRVFCIMVDDADWVPPQSVEESVDTTESGNLAYENTMKEATSTTVQTYPSYFQYFITVSIMTEVDPEEGEVLSV